MSQSPSSNPPSAATTFTTQPPPTHHVHNSSDVLPGARGAASQASTDYSTDVTEDPRVWDAKNASRNERAYGAGTDTRAVVAGGQHASAGTEPHQPWSDGGARGQGQGQGRTAFNEERPMGVEPTEQGGVAVGGNPNLPEGHAKMTDKMIGKTQKVAGKLMSKPEMHEKGELREAGGKMAVQGQARAPHD